jgi:hypothetical protein
MANSTVKLLMSKRAFDVEIFFTDRALTEKFISINLMA